MENQASSKNAMLNNGLYLGIASIIVSLILYATGNAIKLQSLSGVIGFILMIVFISVGIRKFKLDNNNLLTFGQALKVGVGIAVISGIIVVIYNQIFINFIEPDFQNQLMEVQRETWREANMTSEQIEVAEEMATKFSSPLITSAVGIVVSAFFGFIISAIAGAIMKRTDEE